MGETAPADAPSPTMQVLIRSLGPNVLNTDTQLPGANTKIALPSLASLACLRKAKLEAYPSCSETSLPAFSLMCVSRPSPAYVTEVSPP